MSTHPANKRRKHSERCGGGSKQLFATVIATWGALATSAAVSAATDSAATTVVPSVGFNRDVRPILSDKCFRCHGPDARYRQAGLRLDVEESATTELDSGATAIVAGEVDDSELVRRIFAHDEAARMPPTDSGKSLTEAEKATLKSWVEQGARYEPHWSFVAPQRTAPPSAPDSQWRQNEIDDFVLNRLQHAGLSPSPEVDRRTLLRRVTFDLTGLPPTVEEVNAFLADASPDAYERVVDRLLASPRYGERMAMVWLDLARYADSDGYEKDSHRQMWPYRDWVVKAFNANMPFNQFTIEQLAGDELPGATRSQLIASAFNRNGPTTSESGSDPMEYEAKYAVDRVSTTATVWLGLTMQCAECHDHKFDPLTAKDFYRMFAFFNQIPEIPLYEGADSPPSIRLFSPEQQVRADELERNLAAAKGEQETQTKAVSDSTPAAPTAADTGALAARIAKLDEELKKHRAEAPVVRVMQDAPEKHPTHILVRGDFRNPGEEVTPGIPAALGSLPDDVPANRLALAQWLVGDQNPLTARVEVNRLWAMCFGKGIVRTLDNLGTQGEWPSHPELLDWLATEFAGNGWDVKAIIKLIVTSGTYRQSSRQTDELTRVDPENLLLARGPRHRLSAEMVRDNALYVSGLLHEQIGGPSVFPYHPPGMWEEMAWADSPWKTWPQDHGANLYRRGLYTFWKRSLLHPVLAVFDAPTRNVCAFERPATNTPLQSFVTLNETSFVEAARGLAVRAVSTAADPPARIEQMYLATLSRPPTEDELQVLLPLFERMHQKFAEHPDAAAQLLAVGESPRPTWLDPVDLAAWTSVAQVVLNLDETLTKE